MDVVNKKLLELISKNYTINDITNELKLSRKQLYYRLYLLKHKGFNFSKSYFSNGETILSIPTLEELAKNSSDTSVDIITSRKDNNFRVLIISDLHLGNKDSGLNALYELYDYAIKNGIHTIFNCGDLIDGIGGARGKPEIDFSRQIEYLIEKYPFDKNIINYTILGNHDIVPLIRNGQDLKQALKNKRYDIIPIGYAKGEINIKDSKIGLFHSIDYVNFQPIHPHIIFKGHSHQSKFSLAGNNSFHVPSLSKIDMSNGYLYEPQALDVTFHFNESKKVNNMEIKQLLIKDKIYILNNLITNTLPLHNSSNVSHNNEVKELPKTRVR